MDAADSRRSSDVLPASRRAAIAVAIGAASGLFAGYSIASGKATSDFAYWWTAARVLLRGGNPYLLQPGSPDWPLPDPLFYPLPALFPVLPFAWMPLPLAGALVLGISGALLAFALAREATHRLWIFASAPYVLALRVGQCTPIVLAAAFLPWLGWLLPWKPQLGLASFAYRPTVRAALLAAVAVGASFLVLPSWVAGWRANLAGLELHSPPLLATWASPVLLLALLRWRTPEGRLFLAMICAPQELFFSDQLALQLVARTRRESALLAASSLLAFGIWYALLRQGDLYVVRAGPWVLALLYGPALLVLLRRRGP